MTLGNARKKIEKLGFELKKVNNCNLFFIENDLRVLEFCINGGIDDSNDITCILTRGKNDNHDSMTDYCAGIFHDNLTKAIKSFMR